MVDIPVTDPGDMLVFPEGVVRVFLCAMHYDCGAHILEMHHVPLPLGVYYHD